MEQTQALCQWGPPAFCGPHKAPTKVRQGSCSPATGWSRVGKRVLMRGGDFRLGLSWSPRDWPHLSGPLLCADKLGGCRALLCLGPSKTTFLHPRRGSAQSKRKHRIAHRTSGALMVDQKPVHQRWLPVPHMHIPPR